jgi:signal transduction histidine kinase
MALSAKKLLITIRNALLIPALVLVWSMLGMVYLERFIAPFSGLKSLFMPWDVQPSLSGPMNVGDRLVIMQNQLDGSRQVAHYSFIVMIGTFALLCVYLTLVYQQKQRRAREIELLAIKNDEIARRNEFIRYISATIGHEFKNNLGRIKRRMDLVRDLPGDVKSRIDENMEKLFADIDIFKRISDERETGIIQFERVDLMQMLETLREQFSDLVDFNFKDSITIPTIFASQTLLRTVFENLIDNAIKYKKPEQERAVIEFSCSEDIDRERKYVTLSFRDRGIGMDEHEAGLCFYKGKASGESWGQGLYFVKYVIGLHAGKIKVGKEYTERGNGTEIIINLPLVEEFH